MLVGKGVLPEVEGIQSGLHTVKGAAQFAHVVDTGEAVPCWENHGVAAGRWSVFGLQRHLQALSELHMKGRVALEGMKLYNGGLLKR
uniref:Uncharacterized protein n=1 Tax=Scleropages formosus TaxID=113540 RepID=A0A8C9RGT5_SCLFO